MAFEGLKSNTWVGRRQQVAPPPPPQQQQQAPPPQQVHTSTVDPSTALQQDDHVQELGSEEQIVRQFYQTVKKSGDVTSDQNSEEITMYRYIIKTPVVNSWADGEFSTYSFTRGTWWNKINVKFYILEDIDKEQAAAISKKVDDLLLLPSYKNVVVPIFQVYNERVKSVIICYPDFDLHLRDWLESDTEDTFQNAGTNLLHPTWCNFIRDTLSCIETIDNLAISQFGDLSSYAWKRQSKCIKIILFPMVTEKFGVRIVLDQFADLLSNQIHKERLHPGLRFELDSFTRFLKAWPENKLSIPRFWVNLVDHPLLLDYDGLSSLIARTWRPRLTIGQIKELESNITIPDGHLSWNTVPMSDPVMTEMFEQGNNRRGFSNDRRGFFTFIKVLAAHYPENCKNKFGYYDPSVHHHPVSLIKNTYPRACAEIYLLSKKVNWLQ